MGTIEREKIEQVLTRFEGKRQTRGYIPCYITTGGSTNYFGSKPYDNLTPMGASGVTIATGIDLGQQSRESLEDMHVPASIIAKCAPYLGKKRQAALQALCQTNGFAISKIEAETFDTCVHSWYIATIQNCYDIHKFKYSELDTPFDELPWQAQAVIVSLLYQRGYNAMWKAFPKTWQALLDEDWCLASQKLRNRSLWNDYHSRRIAEGNILANLCHD